MKKVYLSIICAIFCIASSYMNYDAIWKNFVKKMNVADITSLISDKVWEENLRQLLARDVYGYISGPIPFNRCSLCVYEETIYSSAVCEQIMPKIFKGNCENFYDQTNLNETNFGFEATSLFHKAAKLYFKDEKRLWASYQGKAKKILQKILKEDFEKFFSTEDKNKAKAEVVKRLNDIANTLDSFEKKEVQEIAKKFVTADSEFFTRAVKYLRTEENKLSGLYKGENSLFTNEDEKDKDATFKILNKESSCLSSSDRYGDIQFSDSEWKRIRSAHCEYYLSKLAFEAAKSEVIWLRLKFHSLVGESYEAEFGVRRYAENPKLPAIYSKIAKDIAIWIEKNI